MRREPRVHFAIRVRSDVAEIASVVRLSIRRAVNHPGRIEVSAGIIAVVSAVAFFVNVESVLSWRHGGEVGLHFNVAVANVGEVHGPLRRVGSGWREGGHGHRCARVRATQNEKKRSEADQNLSHDSSNISL